jgi:hypothetical protein
MIIVGSRIININGGKAPMTYNLFHKLLECIEPPEEPVPTIDEDFLGGAVTPIEYDHNDIFGVPTLEELGKYLMYCQMYNKLIIYTVYIVYCSNTIVIIEIDKTISYAFKI